MAEASIQLRNISKHFGERPVLQDITCSFSPGKIYGVVGPSGAGKSTLLRILNLLETPSAGEVYYFNKVVARSERLKLQRRMAMVFQQPVLFSGSVLDNVVYGLKVRGENIEAGKAKIKEVLSRVGLDGRERQKALTLSGGEAQRLALARVLILQPEILLLDEPTANLDPANVKMIEKLLLDIKQERSTTIILVTHNLFQAKRIADEVLFIYEGKLIEAKPAREIFAEPQHELTKAFMAGELVW